MSALTEILRSFFSKRSIQKTKWVKAQALISRRCNENNIFFFYLQIRKRVYKKNNVHCQWGFSQMDTVIRLFLIQPFWDSGLATCTIKGLKIFMAWSDNSTFGTFSYESHVNIGGKSFMNRGVFSEEKIGRNKIFNNRRVDGYITVICSFDRLS